MNRKDIYGLRGLISSIFNTSFAEGCKVIFSFYSKMKVIQCQQSLAFIFSLSLKIPVCNYISIKVGAESTHS